MTDAGRRFILFSNKHNYPDTPHLSLHLSEADDYDFQQVGQRAVRQQVQDRSVSVQTTGTQSETVVQRTGNPDGRFRKQVTYRLLLMIVRCEPGSTTAPPGRYRTGHRVPNIFSTERNLLLGYRSCNTDLSVSSRRTCVSPQPGLRSRCVRVLIQMVY